MYFHIQNSIISDNQRHLYIQKSTGRGRLLTPFPQPLSFSTDGEHSKQVSARQENLRRWHAPKLVLTSKYAKKIALRAGYRFNGRDDRQTSYSLPRRS
jgi:hypothetical protein